MHLLFSERLLSRIEKAVPWAAALLLLADIYILLNWQQNALVAGSNVSQFLASFLAAVGCLVPIVRYRAFTREFWVLLQIAFVIWTIAQVFWTLGEYEGSQWYGGFGWTDLVFFFSFSPFALMLLLTDTEESGKVNWQRALDVLQVGMVIFCAYLYVFYVPQHLVRMGSGIDRKMESFFAFRNIIIAVALWVRAVLTRSKLERSLFTTAGFFVSFYAVCTRAPNYLRLHNQISTGEFINVLWAVPFLVAAVMAVKWRPTVGEASVGTPKTGVRTLLALHATPALIPLLVIFIAAQIAADAEHQVLAVSVILGSFLIYSLRLAVTQYSQQLAAEALQMAEARFRHVFSKNPLPMWVWDRATFMFLEVNNAAVEKYGYTREEFLASDILKIQTPE